MINSRRLQTLLSAAFALVVVLAFAAPSGAATRIGKSCTTGLTSGSFLVFQSTVAGGGTFTVPSSGVVTRWGSMQDFASFPPLYVRLAVASGGVGSIKLDSVGAVNGLRDGVDESFPERLSVTAGQAIGMWGFPTTPICTGVDPGNAYSYYPGDPTLIAPGITFSPVNSAGVQLNLWADIEPDVDLDGFGDETQDLCPQSAAYQIACPVLSISQLVSANSKQISILATASVDASLTATAKTKIGRKTVTIKGKATSFKAGKLKTVKLKLPSSVKSALKSGKKLKTTVTLTGNGIANTATATKRITLRK